MPPLRREQLDTMRCGMEHHGQPCNHPVGAPLVLHGRCHMKAGTRVVYEAGVLSITCKACSRPICDIAVAGPLTPDWGRALRRSLAIASARGPDEVIGSDHPLLSEEGLSQDDIRMIRAAFEHAPEQVRDGIISGVLFCLFALEA